MRFLVDTQHVPRDPHSQGVQVIAAGLWRCATSSLQIAFEEKVQPSLAPSMHGAYVMPSVRVMKLCTAACREQDTGRRRKLLRHIFTGYNASSDYPGMAFVDDLLDMYPFAKVILNQRKSATVWKSSVEQSIGFFASKWYLLIGYWVPQSYWHYRVYADYKILAKRRFGTDELFTTDFYDLHNAWVKKVASERGHQVLDWEPSVGWSELCKFLDLQVPVDVFPQVNEGEAIAKLKRYLILRGIGVWLTVLMAVVSSIYLLRLLALR